MRKRIAVFGNGWSEEFIKDVIEGIHELTSEYNIDILTFLNYTSRADKTENQLAEYNIFTLPDLKRFDGAILLANTFNFKKELDYIRKSVLDSKIPAISLEYKFDDIPYLGTDDYMGMYAVAEHMIKEHSVREIVFIAGIKGHTGSEARLKAALDAAKDNGFAIPDENILYGDFAADPASEALESWMNKTGKKPEAVICANDTMAIGVCEYLKSKGIFVPFDVKVTGFDYIKAARQYEPSITTVKRNWHEMGRLAMKKLLVLMDGGTIEMSDELKSEMVMGQSCGCEPHEESLESKIRKQSVLLERKDNFAYDQHFRHMFKAMRKTQTIDELNADLSDFFKEEGWVEGDEVLLALRPNFFINEGFEGMDGEGYPEKMDVFCHVHDGIMEPIRRMDTADSVLEILTTRDKPGNYIFIPIRVDEFTLGFAALTMSFLISEDAVLYRWCRHMSQYIEQVKSNVLIRQLTSKLENLSVTDGLTGVYNRAGCESIIYSHLLRNQQNGGRSIVMLADVDNLKYINDTFGHGGGDRAICYSVRIMQETFPDDFMIGRYGGDEFLIVGCVSDETDTDRFIKEVDKNMKEHVSDVEYDFGPGISVGVIQLSEGEVPNFDECIKRADECMYKIKAQHKNAASVN